MSGWGLYVYYETNDYIEPYEWMMLAGRLTAPSTGGAEGFMVVDFGQNGMSTSTSCGLALVDPNGVVVDYWCFGSFGYQAYSGPAVGMRCPLIGQQETSSTSSHLSLQRNSTTTWVLTTSTRGNATVGYVYPNSSVCPSSPVTTTLASASSGVTKTVHFNEVWEREWQSKGLG